MPDFSLEFRGYNRVANNLRRLASGLERELDPTVERWAQDTRATLKSTPYPPKRPRQRYVRTGQLANRWAARKRGPSRWGIENTATGRYGQRYATRVVGDAQGQGQAWMHRGRWWVARDVINEQTPELTRTLSKHIEKIWNS